jgi:epoxyqueuosine reductase
MTESEHAGRIKAAAAELGFQRCGIAPAGPVEHADQFARWLTKGYAGTMHYLHRHRDSRTDVRAWLPWARSVIVAALNYRQPPPSAKGPSSTVAPQSSIPHGPQSPIPNPPQSSIHNPQSAIPDPPQSPIPNPQSAIRNPQFPPPPIPNRQSSIVNRQSPRGRVAMYAWGQDYHLVVREKLDALVARMRRIFTEPFEARVCVDTSAIIERELAAAAGLGWIGKNTMVLHPTLGSFFVLGEIITDLPLAPDPPLPDHCGTCTRCLEACPTAAFPRPYSMDARRCISYLTIEHRGAIAPELAKKMGNWVFGCDLCQTVCPFNRRAPDTPEPRFAATLDDATPLLADILSWDTAAYKSHVTTKATARSKLPMWQRNAQIAQQNTP